MPVPPDLLRVHLNFDLDGQDIAVSTFHLKLDHTPGANTNWPEMAQTAATKVLTKWGENMGSSARAQFPSGVTLQSVAAYHLDAATGHALDKGLAVPPNGGIWGGSGNASLPFECALAVSLFGYAPGSFVPDRARKRGRMFLPPLAVNVMEGAVAGRRGRMSAQGLSPVMTGIGAFFNDVHRMTVGQDPLDVGQNWDLVVVSRAGVFSTVVQAVRIGDVIDAQRRRRNNQGEVYSTVQIANS